MNNILLDSLPLWTTAQAQKTSNRGISASNQQLLGIQKLRELILELAVRGKLVPQDPNDEPASELLKKIEAEKKRLIKEGKIKKQSVLSDVEENDRIFQLPSTWEWVKIGNIGYTQTGGTPSKNDHSLFGSDVPFIKPGDIYPKYVDYTNEGLSFKGVDALGRFANEGSVLMVCIGTIGKCNLIDRVCAFNQQINSISPYTNISRYLLLALRTRYFQDTAWEKSSSTTIAILNKGKWENIGIPLPPLAEQHRIVAKVDELMALCDELEKEQTHSNTAHEILVEVLLCTLTDAKNSDDFREAWQRIADCFDTLFTTEHSIDKLKQTILQLAVMGKLVPQDPNDEPASELLKKIAKEKVRLVKEGKIKKQAALPEITEEEKPFDLPEGWEWVKCQDICSKITDGEHITPKRSETGHYLLSARNVTNEGIILEDVDFVPDDEFERIRKRCDPNIGDILISCSGSVGRVALVDKDNTYTMVRSAAMIRPFPNSFDIEYLAILLRSPYLQTQIKERSRQSAQANLFLGAISNLVLVIPPLAEQKSIVSRVDEFFALCDSLKEEIRKAQEIQNVLAEEIVKRVVG
jgi:Restriction endonuclease S subunits